MVSGEGSSVARGHSGISSCACGLRATQMDAGFGGLEDRRLGIIPVLMDKNLNKEAFKGTVTKVWNLEGSVWFNEVGHHRFLVEFQKDVDIERVLNGQPWTFDKHLICIQPFGKSTPPNEMIFNQEPFWIQLHGLPLAAMTVDGGEKIDFSLGEVVYVDVDGDGIGWEKYLRIRVNMDITKPIPRGKLIRVEGKQRWVEFKYERLPLFCFQCGVIKHAGREYAMERTRFNSVDTSQIQYGKWLRATTFNLMGSGDKRTEGRGIKSQYDGSGSGEGQSNGALINVSENQAIQNVTFDEDAHDQHFGSFNKIAIV
ncbi:uncharacterized protein LOC121236564 [Juglans microcarpa x Juglans regia]|uniref:uncharacterized protein LOC121236564 n=1 Tax=Juglans microcarpa x Juglans regia TaxID=2249226 RepID=UPI001B7DB520|nr:uncharacterized protein LOC121236564 [Juglans microcarpa x Juglans regia]